MDNSVKMNNIRSIIKNTGPISIAGFMQEVMFNANYGYYKTKNPIGAQKDFITSPEISSAFSQLIAGYFFSFALNHFTKPVPSNMGPDARWDGAPLHREEASKISFVEMGAGLGTMFYDMLKTFLILEKKLGSNIVQNISFSILEKNPALVKIQQEKLSDLNLEVSWFENFDDFVEKSKDRKIYFVANELFDCFSINQFSNSNGKWQEILVDFDKDEVLAPTLEAFNPQKHRLIEKIFLNNVFSRRSNAPSHLSASPHQQEREDPSSNQEVPSKKDGEEPFNQEEIILEHSFEGERFMDQLSSAIKNSKGFGLIIDYGYYESPGKSTLQAIKSHKKVNIFTEENPYECDLTSLVNFQALQNRAKENSLQTSLINQKEFLTSLGIEEKRRQMIKNSPTEENNINLAINRLISDDHMGELFKCLIIW